MIRLEQVSVYLGHKRVLHDLSCALQDGDFVTVIGPNGAGKSTLLNLIAGQIKPKQGLIWIDGVDVTSLDEEQRVRWVARLHQDTYAGCVPGMTVRDNFALATLRGVPVGLRGARASFPHAFVADMQRLSGLPLGEWLDVPMARLSGGQRQCVALLMALVTKPRVLLLDEPTSALDPVATRNLLITAQKLITDLRITTVMVTHDILLAQKLGNKLFLVRNGRIEHELGAEKHQGDMVQQLAGADYAWLG